MAFDFPASPAEGALFQPAGGPLYKFTNGAWTIPSTPPVMSISDTAPANPIPGQLWWESDTGNAFLWFDDGTSRQWVQFNVSSKPTPGSPFKRTLITASSTTFQYDPTTLYADAEVVGGGAAGGATAGTVTAGNGAAGSGGGAGGYTKKLIQITDAIRAATKTIVVGAAGTSGGGGNSSYADTVNTLTGNGGAAGVNGTQSSQIVIRAGGAGGAATGGDLNMRTNWPPQTSSGSRISWRWALTMPGLVFVQGLMNMWPRSKPAHEPSFSPASRNGNFSSLRLTLSPHSSLATAMQASCIFL